jgi:endonuclease/exonuclease/phosphatase family metal-dependent hydrolase
MRKNANKSIHGTWHIAFCLLVLFLGMPKFFFAEKTGLRVLTINVWSGLDYKGTFRMGEYEDPERREIRYQSLLTQVKELDPDIIFVQEANPVAKFTARLADALGFDSIHQVCLAGIKFGHVGIPSNFKEGMSILARPSLELEKLDVWKLSGSFGIYGDAITIHFDESIFSLVGRIIIRKTPVFLVNVHLASLPPKDPQLVKQFEGLIEEGKLSKQAFQKALEKWEARLERQSEEMQKLIKHLSKLPPGTPVIVAGDFNAFPDSSTIQQFESVGYFDVFPLGQSASQFTWDASRNRNIAFSTRPESVNGIALEDYDLLNSLGTSVPRRIDYIFLSQNIGISFLCLRQISHNFPQFPPTDNLE